MANVNNNLNNNNNNANKNNINAINQDSNSVSTNTNAVNQLMVWVYNNVGSKLKFILIEFITNFCFLSFLGDSFANSGEEEYWKLPQKSQVYCATFLLIINQIKINFSFSITFL